LADQNSINGVRYDEYRSLPTCQEFCFSELTCVAIDFDFSDNSCWLHLDLTDLDDVYDQDNTNQYRINRTCAVVTYTSTSTSTTTTATTTATTVPTTGVPVYTYGIDIE